jgi:predicted RNase H-like HicB family nuclease
MLTSYIQAAMRHAKYEQLEDDVMFYGHVPEFPGAWSYEKTLDECRVELESVIEDYIELSIDRHDPLPVIDGVSLEVELAL